MAKAEEKLACGAWTERGPPHGTRVGFDALPTHTALLDCGDGRRSDTESFPALWLEVIEVFWLGNAVQSMKAQM